MRKNYVLSFLLISTLYVNAQQLPPSIVWQKCFGGTGTDQANTIIRTPDNGYLIGGSSTSNDGDVSGHHGSSDSADVWIVKASSDGNLLWQKSLGGSGVDILNQLIATNDGGYIGIGTTTSNDGDVSGNHGKIDFWVVKLDRQGSLLWQKCYGGSAREYPRSIKQTPDGGYIIIGTTESNDGDVSGNHSSLRNDIWVIKITNQGVLEWQKCYGGYYRDNGYDVVSLPNNEYLLAVDTDSQDGDFEGTGGDGPVSFILKINATGEVLQRSDGRPRASAYSIKPLPDGNYILLNSLLNCYPMNPNTATAVNKLSPTLNISSLAAYSYCTSSVTDESYSYSTTGPDNIIPISNGENLVSMSTDHKTNTNQNHGSYDGLVSKFSMNGDILWQKCFGGSQLDKFTSIIANNQFSFVTSGYTYSNDGDVTGNRGGCDFWIVQMGQINLVKGVVFADYNTNNVRDNAEPLVNNIIVESEKGMVKSGSSTYNGIFTNSVDTGTYSTKVLTPIQYYTPIPVSKTSTFTTYNAIDSISFALQPIPGKRDYLLNIFPTTYLRPGFDANYLIQYQNVGTDTLQNKLITLVKDSRLQFLSSSPVQSSANGDTIRWIINSLLPRDTGFISINLQAAAPPFLNFMDTTLTLASIDTSGDLSVSNNTGILKQIVTGAFDPNDKQESHGGQFSPREIQDNLYLIYTIRFQNTGNDTAFNIVVKDTLSPKFDFTSLEMVSASHPYKLDITDQNKLAWSFNNIKLVDSIHNEPESHGYITYRIKPKSTLALGDTVSNSASIYFDFNPPVRTNTHITIIKAPPTIAKPQVANLLSSYCNNSGIQKGRIVNFPADDEIAVSVKLDENNLAVGSDSTFRFDVNNLSVGEHLIVVSYSSQIVTEKASFKFSITKSDSTIVKLSANVIDLTNSNGPVIITAKNLRGGGLLPLFTFAKDRYFTNILQSESANNTLDLSSDKFNIGSNWIYAKMKTSEVCYINQNGIDSIKILKTTGSGITDEDYPSQVITLYPNPVKASINIKGLSVQKSYTIIIYNPLGQEVHKEFFSSTNSITIFKNNLPAGKYLVSIYDSKKQKLIGTFSVLK